MNIAAPVVEHRIADLRVIEFDITAYLVDGRTVSVPLARSWRLSEATPVQRDHWELSLILLQMMFGEIHDLR